MRHRAAEEQGQPTAYYALIGLSLVFSILAVLTLVPNPGASKPNVLGYRSICSFAPAATALCGLLAGITCTLRNRRVSRRAAAMRYRPLFVPIGVSVVLVGLAAGFGGLYLGAESRFRAVITETATADGERLGELADGTRRATVRQGEISATVEVTVASGRIEGLRLLEGRNVEPSLAATLFEAVRDSGSTRVDTVSGATASSQVLLQAIEAAAGAGPR